MQAESRSEARLWGESECRTRHALRRSASGAHEQGWPLYRVRAVGAIQCLGLVAQALPGVLSTCERTAPTFLLQATTRGLRWVDFFLIKVVWRPLRSLIQPLVDSALLAFLTSNLASLKIVVVRLSACRFDFAGC